MSDYNDPKFGIGHGINAFHWRVRPAVSDPAPLTSEEKNRIRTREAMRVMRAAAKAPMTEPVPSKWNKAQMVPAKMGKSSFNVHIASQDESRRTNAIGGQL